MYRNEAHAMLLKLKQLKEEGIEVSITMDGKAELSFHDGRTVILPLWPASKMIEAES